MNKHADSERVFELPTSEGKAGQVFYAIMLAGACSVPMLFAVYHRFIEPRLMIGFREMFLIFTVVYILFFSFCTGRASTSSTALRKHLSKTIPRNVVIVAVAAANSGNTEVIVMGKRYWFWQLTTSFLTGLTFSWFICLFVLFIA